MTSRCVTNAHANGRGLSYSRRRRHRRFPLRAAVAPRASARWPVAPVVVLIEPRAPDPVAVRALDLDRRRDGRQDVFAYGPFLCLGALLALLLQD